MLLSAGSELKSHGLVAVCPDFPCFTIPMQRKQTVLRRKELCFSWPRAHEEKEECFSTGDSTGAKMQQQELQEKLPGVEITAPHNYSVESREFRNYRSRTGFQPGRVSSLHCVTWPYSYTLPTLPFLKVEENHFCIGVFHPKLFSVNWLASLRSLLTGILGR